MARRKSIKNWRPGNPQESFEADIIIPTDFEWWGVEGWELARECAEEMESMVKSEFPGISTRLSNTLISDGPDADMIDEWVGEHAEKAVQRVMAGY